MNSSTRDSSFFGITHFDQSGDRAGRCRAKTGLARLLSGILAVALPCWLLVAGIPQVHAVDAFTEIFTDGDNDLDYWMLTFVPDGSTNHYAAYGDTITDFPTDPAGGTTLALGDDNSVLVTLIDGANVHLYGIAYDRFYVGANGFITFGEGDTAYSESLEKHFRLPRISGLFDDLNPVSSGSVSWKQLADRVVVTFDRVPGWNSTQSNSFQIEHFFDGTIRIAYLSIGATGGLAGLSAGLGLPPGFQESDLTGYNPKDGWTVTPNESFGSTGYAGGPFSPESKLYALHNAGVVALNWSTAWSSSWLSVTPAGGALAVGESIEVAVSFAAAAATLGAGNYADTVVFSNTVSGVTHQRTVTLDVVAIPGEIEVTDSILPANDHEMLFGQVFVGLGRREQIAVRNTNATHDLVINGIDLGYYKENFENGLAQGWVPADQTQWSVVDGEYRAQELYTDTWKVSAYNRRTWSDGSYCATIRRTGDVNYTAALFVRVSPDFVMGVSGSAYGVGIGDGSFWVMQYSGTQENWLTDYWVDSPYLHKGEASNDVVFDVQGSSLRVFFNGHLAWSGTDSAVPGPGGILLAGYSIVDSPVVHYFDNIRVSPALSVETDVTTLSNDFHIENLPLFPVTLPPGGSFLFDVIFKPSTSGIYENKVLIASNDRYNPMVEVMLSGEGIPDLLRITPETDMAPSGYPGGPFPTSTQPYTLINDSGVSLPWTVSCDSEWITLSTMSGSLTPFGTNTVTVSLSSAADTLPPGSHHAVVSFSNQLSGVTCDRVVLLTTVELPLPAAIDQPGWSVTTGGNAEWFGQTRITQDGVDAAASGSITHNQQSFMETTVSGPGTLSFWWRVSSEANWDWLDFSLDGKVVQRISGEVDWTKITLPLAAGEHTLRWRYIKDRVDYDPVGEDRGWVDQVVWTPPFVNIESFALVDGQYELVVASGNISDVEVSFRTNLIYGVDWAPVPSQSIIREGNGQYRVRFPLFETACGFFRVIGAEER